MGFVDLHLHLLHELDDGSRSLEDSLEMARVLLSLGFTAAAPSPHNRGEFQSVSRDLCLTRLGEVRQALATAALTLELHENAENYFLEAGLMESVSNGTSRRVADGRYLLVEAPYTSPLPLLTELVFRMKLKGVTTLIAHPERCLEFHKAGRAAAAVQVGAALQLDIGALIGKYGKPAQKFARQWLDEGLYAIAATDLHSPKGAAEWVSKSLEALEKAVGPGGMEALLVRNPQAILRGEELA